MGETIARACAWCWWATFSPWDKAGFMLHMRVKHPHRQQPTWADLALIEERRPLLPAVPVDEEDRG